MNQMIFTSSTRTKEIGILFDNASTLIFWLKKIHCTLSEVV